MKTVHHNKGYFSNDYLLYIEKKKIYEISGILRTCKIKNSINR